MTVMLVLLNVVFTVNDIKEATPQIKLVDYVASWKLLNLLFDTHNANL